MVAGAAALPTVTGIARAQAFPTRPLTFVVFVPAGGTPDIIARLVGQAMSEQLGQSVIIDNRPGVGGNLALQAVARAPADGYTLLQVATPHCVNVTLYQKLNVTGCDSNRCGVGSVWMIRREDSDGGLGVER
jgi:tripartite-type tricarboxylate transporter receptor subunit TctC